METKHTKGEWEIERQNVEGIDGAFTFRLISQTEGKIIGRIFCGQSNEGRANAKLIASAPDLLDAAMQLIDELNNVSVEFPEHTWNILNKIEEAIKKATK